MHAQARVQRLGTLRVDDAERAAKLERESKKDEKEKAKKETK